jgi:hemerythrin-like domain-containing protein/predicted transcriptional regulator
MRLTDSLRRDHEVIERVLDGLDGVAGRLAQGRPVPASLLEGAIEFFGGFVDRCHHAKEEALLPALCAHGLRDDEPFLIAVRAEHARARELLASLDGAARSKHAQPDPTLAHRLREYVALVRGHVEHEDRTLFPVTERLLSTVEEADVQAWFDAVEAREGGPAVRSAAHELAEAMAEVCRVDRDGAAERPRIAADVMRRGVPPVSPDESLASAAGVMERLGVRELPVVKDGRLVGIVVQSDLEAHRGQFEWTPVRIAMTSDPVTVVPEASTADVARVLISRCFNAVPVVGSGLLVGMIARSDLLNILVP